MFGHGKNTCIYLDQFKIYEYLDSVQTPVTQDTAETSVFMQDSKTYIPGMDDATISVEGFFDKDLDDDLKTALDAGDNIWSVFYQGDSKGSYGKALKTNKTNFATANTLDNAVRVAIAGQSVIGIDQVISLCTLSTSTETESITSLDNSASSADGGVAYLHVTDVTGTISIKLEHSDDDAIWSDLVSFSDVSAVGAQRITFSGTVERYVRLTLTLDGAESITYQASIKRN